MTKRIISILTAFLWGAVGSVSATTTCYARLEADTLRMGNSCIERVFVWNGGAVRTVGLKDCSTGAMMQSVYDLPDFVLAKEAPQNAKLEVIQVAETKWAPDCVISKTDVADNYR